MQRRKLNACYAIPDISDACSQPKSSELPGVPLYLRWSRAHPRINLPLTQRMRPRCDPLGKNQLIPVPLLMTKLDRSPWSPILTLAPALVWRAVEISAVRERNGLQVSLAVWIGVNVQADGGIGGGGIAPGDTNCLPQIHNHYHL